jgi:hypothetical protein
MYILLGIVVLLYMWQLHYGPPGRAFLRGTLSKGKA